MMKKPTDKEIAAEIERLETMKPDVRPTSAFGDDHHAAIDAQVKVLKEDMDENDIYAEWEDVEDLDKEYSIISAAREAADWRDGEAKEKPSDGWKELLVR